MFNYQKLLIILTVISVILSIVAIKYFFSINSLIAVKKNTDLSSIIGHDIKDTQVPSSAITADGVYANVGATGPNNTNLSSA